MTLEIMRLLRLSTTLSRV